MKNKFIGAHGTIYRFTSWPPPLPKNERLREFIRQKIGLWFLFGIFIGWAIAVLVFIAHHS